LRALSDIGRPTAAIALAFAALTMGFANPRICSAATNAQGGAASRGCVASSLAGEDSAALAGGAAGNRGGRAAGAGGGSVVGAWLGKAAQHRALQSATLI